MHSRQELNYDKSTVERVSKIVSACGTTAHDLIPVLQKAQEEFKYLPADVLAIISELMDLPPAKVYGVATFYAHFTLHPKGKHIIKICDGTACHVKGSIPILEHLQKYLNLDASKTMTDDGLFSLETVSCLGACGLAPVLVVGDEVHGQANGESAEKFVESIKATELVEPKN